MNGEKKNVFLPYSRSIFTNILLVKVKLGRQINDFGVLLIVQSDRFDTAQNDVFGNLQTKT